MKLSTIQKKAERAVLIDLLKKQAHGHYLDRIARAAEVLDRSDISNAVLSLKQLYNFCQCQPKGVTDVGGILWILSLKIISECKHRGFTKQELNSLYYVVYSSIDLGLTALPEDITDEARSNT